MKPRAVKNSAAAEAAKNNAAAIASVAAAVNNAAPTAAQQGASAVAGEPGVAPSTAVVASAVTPPHLFAPFPFPDSQGFQAASLPVASGPRDFLVQTQRCYQTDDWAYSPESLVARKHPSGSSSLGKPPKLPERDVSVPPCVLQWFAPPIPGAHASDSL